MIDKDKGNPRDNRPLTKEQTQYLENLYYKKKNFIGRDALFDKVEREQDITRRQMMRWLRLQETYQLHAKLPKRKDTRPIYSGKVGKIIQADLIDYSSQPYRNYHYILTVIDIFSRKAWAYPLKDKEQPTVAAKLLPLLQRIKPSVIQTDQGKEFKINYGESIKHITGKAYVPQQQSGIERWNGSLKRLLRKYMHAYDTRNWPDGIEDIVDSYNDTKHSTIKMTPNQLYNAPEDVQEAVAKKLKIKLKLRYGGEELRLPVGQLVRIREPKKGLGKQTNLWSKEVYKVDKVIEAKNELGRIRYKLKDEDGDELHNTYNITELQPINGIEAPPANLRRRRSLRAAHHRERGISQREVEELQRIRPPTRPRR